MSQEQRLKSLEERVKELERIARRRRNSILLLSGATAILFVLMFAVVVSFVHLKAYSKAGFRYASGSYTYFECGRDKIYAFSVKKDFLLGIFPIYYVKDRETGKRYPILGCELKLGAKKDKV